ncbi:nitroreductase family protein [Fuchsiella alkaliacetigena]|uniref:nitroreductase family protein n=1 Tax=Fuchsiella alkaliacetigena TaxID=957042 RepID=UPI00200B4875|nr:nitroreductase family protein [Fuchsiella alkaliacetigena]MCK8824324.1 nitroreductase family protein [Fuchsiella alkaliacetigena]
MKKIYNLIRILYNYFKIRFLKDDKLVSLFRKKIHSLENKLFQEEIILIKTLYIRKIYFEAKKRDLLSEDEINWGKRVLFGENNSQIVKKDKFMQENDFFGIIKNRRSVRKFKNEEVSDEILKKLINAARWAPTSCNRQPWEFIIIADKELIEKVRDFRGQKFISDAPYCILVLMNKNLYHYDDESLISYYLNLDAGAAIQNILLMAEYLNLSACWVNLADNNLSDEERKEMKELFNIPEKMILNTVIPIGYSDFNPNPPGRKDLEEIIYYNKLG